MNAKEKLINDLWNLKEDYMSKYFYNSENYVPDGAEDFECENEYCHLINDIIESIKSGEFELC